MTPLRVTRRQELMADMKTQTEYYVSKGETQLGPWTIAEVANQLAIGAIAVTDFVYDDAKADWIALFECAALKEHMEKSKPKVAPPKRAAAQASVATSEPAPQQVEQKVEQRTEPKVEKSHDSLSLAFNSQPKPAPAKSFEPEAEWFIQKGANRYGPFTYLGVVRALQEKTVYEFDLIWKTGMTEWVRIAEHAEFSPDRIRDLVTTKNDAEGIFQQRQHPRIAFDSEVIVHDNRSAWLGKAYEGSAGGSGLVIENATLVPGQTVLLHFAAREDLPSFNALCEIVGKRYTKEIKDARSPVHYAVRFLKIDPMAEPKVKDFFTDEGKRIAG